MTTEADFVLGGLVVAAPYAQYGVTTCSLQFDFLQGLAKLVLGCYC
jgi:hypothetical protein